MDEFNEAFHEEFFFDNDSDDFVGFTQADINGDVVEDDSQNDNNVPNSYYHL